MRRSTQLDLPLGTSMKERAKTTERASTKTGSERNGPDRVFVPLSAEPYSWFESGKKTWELRKAQRQFTETHLRTGRYVELRRGYSDARTALWGQISDVIRARSVEEFFLTVPHSAVIPAARSVQEAIQIAKEILNLGSQSNMDVIGFEVDLDWVRK